MDDKLLPLVDECDVIVQLVANGCPAQAARILVFRDRLTEAEADAAELRLYRRLTQCDLYLYKRPAGPWQVMRISDCDALHPANVVRGQGDTRFEAMWDALGGEDDAALRLGLITPGGIDINEIYPGGIHNA